MTGSDIGAIMMGIAAIITAVARIIIVKPPPGAPGKIVEKPSKKPSKKQWFLGILPMILAVFAVSLATVPRIIPSPALSIKIISPEDKVTVSQEIIVEGYTTKELPEDRYLYITVQWKGRWWPQYSNVTPVYSQMNKRWEFRTPATISSFGEEYDVGKTFMIVAVLVDTAIHQGFKEWFQRVDEGRGVWWGIPITLLSDWGEKKIYDSIAVTRE